MDGTEKYLRKQRYLAGGSRNMGRDGTKLEDGCEMNTIAK
jgi:hypothetical protein